MKRLIIFMVSAVLLCGFAGRARAQTFNEKQDISVVSREAGSGTRGAFIELFQVEEKDTQGNKRDRTTVEAIIAPKTDVMLTNVAGDVYAIGYVSIGSLNNSVKALKINGIEATAENVKSGSYVVARPFIVATKSEISEVTQDFLTFILSEQGQSIVEAGYTSVSQAAPFYTSGNLTGKVIVAGSSSVTPLMEKLKEAYEVLNPNVQIEVHLSDSTAGVNGAIAGTCDIGMASRELKEGEKAQLNYQAIALDGIAVITNTANPLEELSTEQVRDIFTGAITKWNQL